MAAAVMAERVRALEEERDGAVDYNQQLAAKIVKLKVLTHKRVNHLRIGRVYIRVAAAVGARGE